LSPPSGRPTIEDVAAASNVSVATVSRALRGLPNVAAETRARVRDAATALNYEVDPQASGLATGKTMTIGLVAPLFGLWYADQVVVGAESVVARDGYDLLVTSVRDVDSLDAFLQRVRGFGRRIDGALLIDLFAGGDQLTRLAEIGVPAVSVGEDLGRWPSVTVDNEEAAATATRHLLDAGHTRIGLIGGVQHNTLSSPVPERRRRGWEAALRSAGLRADPALAVNGGFVVEGGAAGLATLLELDEPPTAVFCMSDRMALGALNEARRRGLDVPGDLSIVGFDDDDIAESFGLSTMRQPVTTIGATAAELLLGMISGEAATDEVVTLPVELIVRASCGIAPR
jgi:LacI family repressor for deo operon, udp, cdd, tsx, nupC, and nupG